jgi:hypothetical protein
MLGHVLAWAGVLTIWGQAGVQRPDAKPKPGAAKVTAPAVDDEAARAEALAQYNGMREKAADTAEAQWKLALWCEKHGLKPEARAHLAAVARHDPKRELAWKKLGYRKVGDLWLTADDIKDLAEQKKADKKWVATLLKWHAHIHGGPRQAAAMAALAKIDDPRAVPAVLSVLGRLGPTDQLLAVQILGQIRTPKSSRALATLAVYSSNANVRAAAAQTLRDRPAEEYVPTLAELILEPLSYEIVPVGGPGSPGVLMVEGERFMLRRTYAPPPPPMFQPGPGDVITYDAMGLPVVNRPLYVDGQPNGRGDTIPLLHYARVDLGPQILEAQREAQLATLTAEAQLLGDLRRVLALNLIRRNFTANVVDILRRATGKKAGDTAKAWRDWLSEQRGYAREDRAKDRPKEIVEESVEMVV